MVKLKRNVIGLMAALTLAVGVLATPVLFAQEDEDTVTCSSDLIVMLYVAERYFDYANIHGMAMDTDTEALDLTTIDRGQFAPAFDAMMLTMGEDSMTDESAASDLADLMAMDESELNDQLAGDMDTSDMTMTPLTPAVVEDEPEECAQLRAELTHFFTAVIVHDMSMEADMGDMDMPDMEVTEEATVEADMTEAVDMDMTEEVEMTAEPTMDMEATEEMDVTPTAEPTSEGMDADMTEEAAMGTTYTAPLSGPQEVPGPGDADSTGTATVTINQETNEVCWDITVMNAMLPATGAHIHVGAFGESGDVVVPLSAPDASGAASGCTTADASVVSAIVANPAGYYVNIHTTDFPSGALRGQLS